MVLSYSGNVPMAPQKAAMVEARRQTVQMMSHNSSTLGEHLAR
jgi:hypothetical protein